MHYGRTFSEGGTIYLTLEWRLLTKGLLIQRKNKSAYIHAFRCLTLLNHPHHFSLFKHDFLQTSADFMIFKQKCFVCQTLFNV